MTITRTARRGVRGRAGVALIALLGVGIALAGCDRASSGASWYGADPAAIAKAVGCSEPTSATQAASGAPVQYRSVACVIDKTPVGIATYASQAEQTQAESEAIPTLGKNLRKGTYYYASGNGWLAEDTSAYSEAAAKAVVAKIGGAVKSFQGSAAAG
jgi:hypothetical protein